MATPDNAKSSAIPPGNRGWALDNTDTTVRVKPRRPYTPYNLFYLLERELVVQGHEPSVATEAATKKARLLNERSLKNVGKRSEEDIALPSRYKHVVLLPYWYEPNLKEKRKHRKTHGKISFKELTGIISTNWANIDTETKEYCTSVSQIGRTRYKETITRYNAAQKIIQLKKEKVAMENIREQRLEQAQNDACVTPSRRQQGQYPNPTPDRLLSRHAPIVTPPRSGYTTSSIGTNRTPTFTPIGAHAFHPYGPPPPLPPPLPPRGMPGQHPPSMPMYHYQQQQHLYRYLQAPAANKPNTNGYSQAFNSHSSGYRQDFHSHYGHHQLVKHSNAHGGQGGNSFPPSSNQGTDRTVDVRVRMKKKEHPGLGGAVDVHVRMKDEEHPGMGRAVDVHVRTKREEKTSMTHDEALRLCDLMGSDAPAPACGHPEPHTDTLLSGMPSFDFGDYHSLSTEDGAELSKDISIESLMIEVDNEGDSFLDLFDQK